MNRLSKVLIFKLVATISVWCIPLIFMPASWFEGAGFPKQETYMFVRMLGWAYLSLCVVYWFGLRAALRGEREMGPIWVGIVSNVGAGFYLGYYGSAGAWASWGVFVQFVGWASFVAAFAIALGLFVFGVMGQSTGAGGD